jgi:hypothetical protein
VSRSDTEKCSATRPLKWRPSWDNSDIIAAVSTACAIFVFVLGLWQYRASENWKRSEFIAAQIKDFNSDTINQSVLLMMDYNPAHIELFPDKPEPSKRYVYVSFDTLIKAINEDTFPTETEMQVKIYFEHFLTSLSRFEYFLESGAIEPKDLCADFDYPVELMTGTATEMRHRNTGEDIAPLHNAVQGYLTRWGITNIQTFQTTILNACEKPS